MMRIEDGSWTVTVGWQHCHVFDFSTRIVVERSEIDRLRLESCAEWCHGNFDFYDWSVDGDYTTFEGPSVLYYYFVNFDDAMAFYLRWS